MEFPSYVLGVVLLEFVGRRIPLVVFQFISAIACLAMILVPQGDISDSKLLCKLDCSLRFQTLSRFRSGSSSYHSLTRRKINSVSQLLYSLCLFGGVVADSCAHARSWLWFDVRKSRKPPLTVYWTTGKSSQFTKFTIPLKIPRDVS